MAKRDIKIYINSIRYETGASLFDLDEDEEYTEVDEEKDSEGDRIQIKTLGMFELDGHMASLSYDETGLSGLEGSQTVVRFDMRQPHIVSMVRTGEVSTTLVFEKGKRYHCTYKTPFMPFEVCIHTLEVKNRLDLGETLELDYIVEIRGGRAERNKFSMRIR